MRLFIVIPLAAMLATAQQLTWIPQPSGVTARLRGVSAASGKVAWASGASGTILRTIDGGRTWQPRPIPDTSQLDFRDIDAFDANTAYTLSIGPGEASRIYKTSDGGATWTLQFRNTNPKAFFDAMTFWTPEQGIAISDSVDGQFVLIQTADGGRTWTQVEANRLPPALPNEGAFAASGSNIAVHERRRAWIGLGSGRVLHTKDAGRSWSIARTGLATSATAGIFSISFLDARHGIVTGGDYKAESSTTDNAAITDDGGKTWRLITGLRGLRSAVVWRRDLLLAVGPQGADFSSDRGRSWQPIPGAGFHAFSAAPGTKFGWAVGESGRIAKITWR